MPLLQVRGLVKRYGRREVVSGVDYEVERGEGHRLDETSMRQRLVCVCSHQENVAISFGRRPFSSIH